ncbi:PA2778 family cysteine peptidase [Pokkaliibacter sp. CJK22405]|uniref:PA2778 family cysteine peptidase n=1 Tax=Pokkaliibacter sp. CJK22405 TaxID=3384615 RepID=UPI00398522A6
MDLAVKRMRPSIRYGLRAIISSMAIAWLSGCSLAPPKTVDQFQQSTAVGQSVYVQNVPFFAQEEYQCGPAALAMVLDYQGVDTTPDKVKPFVYLPNKQGSIQVEMLGATRHFGLIPFRIPGTLNAITQELSAGNPVLVFQNLALSWYPQWHYAVVTGYDAKNQELVLHSALDENHRVSVTTFARTWQRGGNWAFVALPPGKMPASADQQLTLDSIAQSEQSFTTEDLHKAYGEALKRWPDSETAALGLSVVYYQMHAFKESQQILEQAITQHPKSAPLYNNLSVIEGKLGHRDSAISAAKRAVALAPDNKDYQQTLVEAQR